MLHKSMQRRDERQYYWLGAFCFMAESENFFPLSPAYLSCRRRPVSISNKTTTLQSRTLCQGGFWLSPE